MESPSFIRRWAEPRVREALADTPVVLLAGPRQAGKTTLVRQLANPALQYLTLDDERVLQSARSDPVGLVRQLDRAVIDEIQRAPELLLALKHSIDFDRRPGRFLLTGSAHLLTLPTVADSLAGRLETVQLYPLSQGEIEARTSHWLDAVFVGQAPAAHPTASTTPLVDRVLAGGYPESRARASHRRRVAWAQQYLDALIARDVRTVAEIEKFDHLPRFVRCLAQAAGQMCNFRQLGAAVRLDGKTAAKYLTALERLYLVQRVEVWSRNALNRLVKTPKLQFLDAGLLSALLGLEPAEVQRDRTRFGKVLESFVYGELLKHLAATHPAHRLFYYRDIDQVEVDLVIEAPDGAVVGVEVKASATVTPTDVRGLKRLASLAGAQFRCGVVLYDGDLTLPLGERLWAVPLSSLWAP